MFEKIIEKLSNEDYTFQGGKKDLKKDFLKFDAKDLTRLFLYELKEDFGEKSKQISEKWGSPWDHKNKHKKKSEKERSLLLEWYETTCKEGRRVINEIRNDTGLVSEFERVFLEKNDEVHKQIREKIEEASKILMEAENLSEKYGVPFYSDISGLGQYYTPASLSSLGSDAKWVLYDFDIPDECLYDGEIYGGGWQQSAIC